MYYQYGDPDFFGHNCWSSVTVARNLDEPGLYVSAAIRQLPHPASPDQRADLIRVADDRVCERIYVKSGKH